MLDFINNNGVLFSGVFAIIAALVTALISAHNENKKSKQESIKSLKAELEATKAELERFTSVERQEQCIDKSEGSMYLETLPNGQKRYICGYCWEHDHKKMPLSISYYYDDDNHKTIFGKCGSCKAACYDR